VNLSANPAWQPLILLGNHRRRGFHRRAHEGGIFRIHADEDQVFLLGRPSMFARLGRFAEHHVASELIAILMGGVERFQIRIGLRFISLANDAYVICVLPNRSHSV
jgi:hypothetical protein